LSNFVAKDARRPFKAGARKSAQEIRRRKTTHCRSIEVSQAATACESYLGLYRDSFLVVATIMDHRVTHPTKEQVRAYMVAREHAHKPPPAPEEIRRQLGWHVAPAEPGSALIGLYMLPATLGQLLAQTALDWCLAPLRSRCPLVAPPEKVPA
jgi:hypothetical protein